MQPEQCVFHREDGPDLERWARDNDIAWVDGKTVTASGLNRILTDGPFCVLALDEDDNGPHILIDRGSLNRGMGLKAALEDAKKLLAEKDCILLDLQTVRQQKARRLPAMDF